MLKMSYENPTGQQPGSVSHIDFYPRRKLPDLVAVDFWERHENLFELLQRANDYLVHRPSLTPIFAETVDVCMTKDCHDVNNESPSFHARGERPRYYAQGIRLWMSDNNLARSEEEPTQLGILNITPLCTFEDPEHLTGLQSEPVNVLLEHLNELPQQDEAFSLERIINVQSLNLEFSCKCRLQPERTVWKDRENARQTFVTMLRVFYLTGRRQFRNGHQKLVIQDFLPRVLCPELQGSKPQRPVLESFSMVFNGAREFERASHDNLHQIVSIQTMKFRQECLEIIDTEKTNFTEDNMRMYYIKYLRVVFRVDFSARSIMEVPVPFYSQPLRLNYKIFIPRLKKDPTLWKDAEFESTSDFEKRLTNWLAGNAHLRIISSESVTMRVFSGAEALEGLDTMHTWNRVIHHSTAAHTHHHNFLHGRTHHRHGVRYREASVARETFVMVLKIYYDGVEAVESTQDRQSEDALTDFMAARQAGTSCCVS
ncbi:hypothetical protein RvY_12251 [Ramazzottius varieornatus]|uniref:Uncharacterized protein n=1 Tax=Ramazzottius varieornatus TaxID=947166 RepID=A0A1D1VL65_RAMVA|nr:hypothetical protein RvY_12251 [Ramazzottius varieornatus]